MARERIIQKLTRAVVRMVGLPLGYLLVRALSVTWRIDRRGAAGTEARPLLVAIWHGDAISGVTELPRLLPNADVMVSMSRDGNTIDRFIRWFGGGTVRGSSGKHGTAGLRALDRALKAGHSVVVLVDGPRGPFGGVKPGIVAAASASGAPIVPGAVLCDRAWRFRSWDRFHMPKPFARVAMVYGEPMTVAPGLDRDGLEAARADLERRLMALHVAEGPMLSVAQGPVGRAKVKGGPFDAGE